MTCGGCENAVKRILGKIEGLDEFEVSHADKRLVATTSDPELITEKLTKWATAAGKDESEGTGGTSAPASRKGRKRRKGNDWAIHDRVCLLSELFEKLPAHVSFNVEIKYPILEKMHTGEAIHDRNTYLNIILKDIFDHNSKERAILFSSFDPEICLLLAMKQPR